MRKTFLRKPEEQGSIEFAQWSNFLPGKDNNLQFSKRIDWRFLLPDPLLKRVVFIGHEGGDLLQALSAFSQSFVTISRLYRLSNSKDSRSNFDLVVSQSCNIQDLRLAHGLLRPGGYLYWEIDKRRLLAFKSEHHKKCYLKNLNYFILLWGRFNRFGNLTAHLERLGFRDIRFQWHRPNFKQCLEIVPLNNAAALRYMFSRAKSNFSGRLKLTAGRFLLNTNLLKYLVQCVSVVACKKGIDKSVT